MAKQNTENLKFEDPNVCPVCGDANNVDFDGFNLVSDNRGYFDCQCNNCGATWKSWYNLVFDKNNDVEKDEQND